MRSDAMSVLLVVAAFLAVIAMIRGLVGAWSVEGPLPEGARTWAGLMTAASTCALAAAIASAA